MRNSVSLLLIALLCGLAACRPVGRVCPGTVSKLTAGFAVPQDSTRTKVWWFHGETETTREGITADLEAFRRAGVGGVVYYDQVHNKRTPDALPAMSSAWWEMLLFAAAEAERLGLSFECHVSNGYVAGGPWITPDKGMQMLLASDTLLQGGRFVSCRLPVPEGISCKRDVAVLAFPVDRSLWTDSRMDVPVVSSNLPEMDAEAVFSSGKRLVRIPSQESGGSVYLNMDFGSPFTARSITYQAAPRGKATTSATNVPGEPGDTFVGTGYRVLPPLGQLEASRDGVHYRKVCDLPPIYKAHSSWKQKTVAFPAVSARYFRLNLHDWQTLDNPRQDMQLGDVCLSARASVDAWEEKAGLYSEYITGGGPSSKYKPSEVIAPTSVIDLTDQCDAEGRLSWEVPAGTWAVLRFVQVPTGSKTKHGRPGFMGLECDKLSADAALLQWKHYFGAIADTLAAHGLPLKGMVMDSHEAGSQNWTPGFDREFASRRGYEMMRYLPAMAGYVVGSERESDAFLYDVRRTIADLIADNYYATFEHLCRERGLDFTAQATGNALCIVADPIQAKGRVSKPQGEFWAIHPDGNYDIKECSSAAHLYGKTIASGEAFTDAKYSHSLAYLKSLADYAYCFGLNEFVVCASAYQPWLDRIPGNTGGGRHYCLNRNNTCWEYSRGFWDYQSRLSYVMRQGRPVIDLAVYLGENAPVKILTHRLPDIPSGFDFDAFTSDALFARMEARDGQIVLPDGMSYRMVVLPRNGELTLAALQKIAEFVDKGVPVYGPRPVGSPSYAEEDDESGYWEWVARLWGERPLPRGSHRYGRGTVYWGMPLAEAMEEAGLSPDISMSQTAVKPVLYFVHRQLEDADVYFLDNRSDRVLTDTFTFRSRRRTAELWTPVDGRRYQLPSSADGAYTSVPLRMAPHEAYLVVLSDAPVPLPPVSWQGSGRRSLLDGPWEVTFDPRWGGPGTVVLDSLTDWTRHVDSRIRYYSGTAVYRNSFTAHRRVPDEKVFLRFSTLAGAARVIVNGQDAGTVWCSPWEIEVTGLLREGENVLEIQVANSLMNRMIGDASLPLSQRYTYAFPEIASPSDSLVPSGIIGPLMLEYRR